MVRWFNVISDRQFTLYSLTSFRTDTGFGLLRIRFMIQSTWSGVCGKINRRRALSFEFHCIFMSSRTYDLRLYSLTRFCTEPCCCEKGGVREAGELVGNGVC